MEILVARQPIFDPQERVYGYDLALRGRTNEASASPDAPPPEQLVAHAFLGIGLDRLVGDARAFITVDADMLLGDSIRVLPRDRVVLQLPAFPSDHDALVSACDRLLWQGYRMCASASGELPDALLRLVDIAKVDVTSHDAPTLASIAARLRTAQVRMLAVGVRHRGERDSCTKLGFEFFQGYRFSAAETLVNRDLSIEHVQAFRVFKMLRNPGASDQDIEELLRRDVALSYKLLRMVNSASMGQREIWSLGHALRLLGRERVANWVGLLLVTDASAEGVRSELSQSALLRARVCELLADATGMPRSRGPLFLVGLFSLLDQILETPMESLVAQMELGSDVRAALLERADYFGAVLSLVEAYEDARWTEMEALALALEVKPDRVAQVYLEALSWVRDNSMKAPAPTPTSTPAMAARR